MSAPSVADRRYEYQPPQLISQPGAVQNTWYPVVPIIIYNCKLLDVIVAISAVNETLEARTIIDGVTEETPGRAATFNVDYYLIRSGTSLGANMYTLIPWGDRAIHGFLKEGKSVAVQARKTTNAGAGTLTAAIVHQVKR